MARRVDILSKTEIFKKFIFRIEEARLRHERYNGTMSDELVRLNLNRGDSVAAVIHNTRADIILLTEQFRYPAYEKGPGWLLELPAGVVEDGEAPQETMERELKEEIGYIVEKLQPICKFYVSPGGTSERIHLFYARVRASDQVSKGGGLLKEGEDIRTVALPTREAIARIASGEIVDAKTIIGLQWLQLQNPS